MRNERYCGVCRAIIDEVSMCPYCVAYCCPWCNDPMERGRPGGPDFYCRRCDQTFELRLIYRTSDEVFIVVTGEGY